MRRLENRSTFLNPTGSHPFSRGSLTVSKLHHSLSDTSTRAATVVGSWMALEGAIPSGKILRMLKDKASRKRKRALTNAGDAGPSAATVVEVDTIDSD